MPRAIVDGQPLAGVIAGAGGAGAFGGSGALGNVTISSPTDMTGVLNYDNLTITTTGSLSPSAGSPLQVLVKSVLTIQGVGALHADGRGSGTPGTGGTGGAGVFNSATNPGVVGGAAIVPAGFNSTVFTASGGSGAGGGGAYTSPSTWTSPPAGQNGLNRDSTYLVNVSGAAVGGQGAGGSAATDGGNGLPGVAGGTGGAATPATASLRTHLTTTGLRDWHLLFNGGAPGCGGNGGGGAGASGIGPTSGGAGGTPGSQSGAGVGTGGTGATAAAPTAPSAGGGGGGGAGGYGGGGLYIEVGGNVDLDSTARVSADGGAGGAGGAGGGNGAAGVYGGGGGAGGSGGGGGWVVLLFAGDDVQTTVDGTRVHAMGGAGGAVGAGGASSGSTVGGAGGPSGAGEDGYVVIRKVA